MSATVEQIGESLVVLCALRHVIEVHPLETFAHSAFEAEMGARYSGDRFDRAAAKCQGHGHLPDVEG